MGYGHALRAAGRRAEAVDAYRRSLALAPGLGEAWWGLTNLGAGVTPDDAAAMEVQLGRLDLSEEDRVHLHFALGRAHEAGGRYEEAFRSYAEGNAQRKYELAYDPEETGAKVRRCKALLTADVLAARPGPGRARPRRMRSSSSGCRGREPPWWRRSSLATARWKRLCSRRT